MTFRVRQLGRGAKRENIKDVYGFTDENYECEDLLGAIAESSAEVFLAHMRGEVIGAANARLNDDGVSAEVFVCVKEQYRNMGAGTRLLELELAHMKRIGITRANAFINARSADGTRFAESNGFLRHMVTYKLLYCGKGIANKPHKGIVCYDDSWFERVIALRNSGIKEADALYGIGQSDLYSIDDDELRRDMCERSECMFMVCEGEKLTGFAIADIDGAEIRAVNVAREARGTGLGQALVERCIAELIARGERNPCLFVTEKNITARMLYDKCGFKQVGTYYDYYKEID